MGSPAEQKPEAQPQPAAPTPVIPKALSTLERISILSDLANAARDEEIVRVLKTRPNGERLYDLFVKALSDEIEGIMNPAQVKAPQAMNNLEQVAQQSYQLVHHIGGILASIEQGPALMALRMLIQQFNGGQAPTMPQVPQPQYQPQPAAPAPQPYPQPQTRVPGPVVDVGNDNQPAGRAGRGGALSSW